MNMMYVLLMLAPRTSLGLIRALVGVGSWLAPDRTTRVFGMDPAQSNRFITRLFGARELALATALLTAPDSALAPVAAVGTAVDFVDAVAGFDERRRENLSARATILGPVGALCFVALGLVVTRDASAAAKAA